MATPVSARWTRIATDIIVFAAAAYFAYVGAFIYYFHRPYSTNPGDQRYCLGPHFITAQVCNDWQSVGSHTRLLFTLGFLLAFLAVALIARKFVWTFLAIPLITLQFVNSERNVWLVSLSIAVAIPAVVVLARQLPLRASYRRVRWVPVLALVATTTIAGVLSALNAGLPVASLRTESALSVWPSIFLQSVSCPSAGSCQAVGTTQSSGGSMAVLTLRDGRWSITYLPLPLAGFEPYIACSAPGECLLAGYGLLFVEHRGRWSANQSSSYLSSWRLQGGPTAACSPHGDCWTVTLSATLQTDVAIGEDAGRWLPPHVERNFSGHSFVFSDAISCPTSTTCTVYDESFRTPGSHGGSMYLQSETDGVWSAARAIAPGDGSADTPVWTDPFVPGPLICFSTGACLVGGTTDSSFDAVSSQSVALYGAGDTWAVHHLGGPLSVPRTSAVETVACASTTLCVASGGTLSHGSAYQYFQTEVGGTWRRPLVEPNMPGGLVMTDEPDYGSTSSTDAACTSIDSCYVVGYMSATNGPRIGFVATYANSAWTFNPLALYEGEFETRIMSISCSQSTCWAVGYAESNSWTRGFVFRLGRT